MIRACCCHFRITLFLLALGDPRIALAAEPTALAVTLSMFSGRPDPQFVINDPVAIRQVLGIFDALPPHPTVADSASFVRPMFGYRGYRITPTGMNGIAVFEGYGSVVEVTSSTGAKSYRFDADAKLDQLVQQIARAAGLFPNDGQPPPVTIDAGTRVVERTITINLGSPIQSFAPLPVRRPTTVLAGTRVKLVATIANEATTQVMWVKDSREHGATGRTLEFVAESAADSGRYWAVTNPGVSGSTTSDAVEILVTNREGPRLINLSVLGRVNSGQPVLTFGFTVEPDATKMNTLLLVRAVGPGLTPLGVSATLPTPSLQITDARGAIVPQANMPFALPTVADATGRVGAFALPNNSADIARLYYLPAGAFTAHVSSADAGTGAVLVEIYEVP